MKIKIFVAREIQYFELGIFSFNSYVCYLTRGFIASTRAFNLLTLAFNLPTLAFSLATRAFSLLTRGFKLVTRNFELVTRGFELATREFQLATCGFELATCNSCFTFPQLNGVLRFCIPALVKQDTSINLTYTWAKRKAQKKIFNHQNSHCMFFLYITSKVSYERSFYGIDNARKNRKGMPVDGRRRKIISSTCILLASTSTCKASLL